MGLGIRRPYDPSIANLKRGDLVEVDCLPLGITEPHPQPGERGVCFEEEDYHEDNTGPMVRFANGGVCNVYEGWVRRVELHPAEAAEGYRRLCTRCHLTGQAHLSGAGCGRYE